MGNSLFPYDRCSALTPDGTPGAPAISRVELGNDTLVISGMIRSATVTRAPTIYVWDYELEGAPIICEFGWHYHGGMIQRRARPRLRSEEATGRPKEIRPGEISRQAGH